MKQFLNFDCEGKSRRRISKYILSLLACFLACTESRAQNEESQPTTNDVPQENTDPRIVKSAFQQVMEDPSLAVQLFATNRPFLICTLAPILSSTEETPQTTREGREALARIFLNIVVNSDSFESGVRNWASSQLQQDSVLPAVQNLISYNQDGFQHPGLPSLEVPVSSN